MSRSYGPAIRYVRITADRYQYLFQTREIDSYFAPGNFWIWIRGYFGWSRSLETDRKARGDQLYRKRESGRTDLYVGLYAAGIGQWKILYTEYPLFRSKWRTESGYYYYGSHHGEYRYCDDGPGFYFIRFGGGTCYPAFTDAER